MVKTLAASAAGLAAICYAVGYLISTGYARKLGLPLTPRDYQLFLARGASYPLGLLANLAISFRSYVYIVVPVTVLAFGMAIASYLLARRARLTGGALRWVSWLLALAAVLISLYVAWTPAGDVEAQGLLLDRPEYIADIVRDWTKASHLDTQLRRDIAIAEAERDTDRRAVLNDRVEKAKANLADLQHALNDKRDVVMRRHDLVYCTYFLDADPRCGGVASNRYSMLCMLVGAALVTTCQAFEATHGRWHLRLTGLVALLVLSVALVLVDYGWLVLSTEVSVVSRRDDGAELLLLGEHDDRFLFYTFEPPAVLMTVKATTPELTVHRHVELFSEILRRAGDDNPH